MIKKIKDYKNKVQIRQWNELLFQSTVSLIIRKYPRFFMHNHKQNGKAKRKMSNFSAKESFLIPLGTGYW